MSNDADDAYEYAENEWLDHLSVCDGCEGCDKFRVLREYKKGGKTYGTKTINI